MILPIQKYLGWAQRFFYQVENGVIPPLQSVLVINHDWPLEMRPLEAAYNTVAGNTTSILIFADNERHFLVDRLVLRAGAGIPTTDDIELTISPPVGDELRPFHSQSRDVAIQSVPIIGGVSKVLGMEFQMGIDPVYIPPGHALRVDHGSLAGGVATVLTGRTLSLPKSYPLRLP